MREIVKKILLLLFVLILSPSSSLGYQTSSVCCYEELADDCVVDGVVDNQTECASICQNWTSTVGAANGLSCTTASGSCVNPSAYGEGVCDCNCAAPAQTIQCLYTSECASLGGGNCVNFTCSTPGSSSCDPLLPLPGSDCWTPTGPCDPANPDHDQAFCTDTDGDGVGQCVCSADAFFSVTDLTCITDSGLADGIKTAIGCLSYTGKSTINQLLVWSVGIGGGIGLLLLGYAGLMVTTAAGDPKRLQAGQELLLSIFAGLFLLATSAVLLNFIGVKILSLENLGFSNP